VPQIKVRVLSKEDIESVLTPGRIMEITEEVFAHFGNGEICSPPKVSVPLQDPGDPGMHWINSMPAFLRYRNVAGLKWVNVTSANSKRGLPVTMGVILLNDAATGMPIAVLDGTWITQMRTGASTAIGAKYFAREDSRVITVVGAGAEGRTNLTAIARCFDLDEARIVDIDKDARARFADAVSEELDLKVTETDTVKAAVATSDMVLLTTTAQEPLMLAEWAKPGDYITTVSCFSDLDHRFVDASDKLYMDDKECTLGRIRAMADLDIPEEKVYGDICEVAAGKKAKREHDREIITYTPAGMGAVDIGVALEALNLARERGLGKEVILAEDV